MERVCAIVDSTPRTHDLHEHFIAIHSAVLGLLDPARPVNAYRKLRAALSGPVPDPAVFLLLVRYGSLVAVRLHRHEEAEKILKRVDELDGQAVPAAPRAGVLLSRAALNEAQSDFRGAFECCTAALALELKVPSPFWVGLKSHRAHYGICCHHFEQAGADIRDIERHEHLRPNVAAPLLALKTHRCCESGLVEQGLAMLDAASGEDAGMGRRQYVALCVQLLLKADRLDEASVMLDQAQSEPSTLSRAMNGTLRAMESLAQKDVQAARGHARASVRGLDRGEPVDFDLSMRTLASAELAGSRASEARRIMLRLDPDKTKPQARMLWARLLLLEDDLSGAVEHFQQAAKLGAAYLTDAVRWAFELSAHDLARLLEQTQVEAEASPPRASPERPAADARDRTAPIQLVGHSETMQRVRANIEAFGPLSAPVLIAGQTGTGKDVVARLLHANSHRAASPFMPINCGALSDTLIESELFGHVKGAFTGAARDHDGLFVAAGAGTIFLDEIHAMSARLQAALLRVLENGEVRPVGSSQIRNTRARVIAATNESLKRLMESGRFRADLYYRLAKLQVHMPTLHERPQDIPALARHFLRDVFGQLDLGLGEDLIEAMKRHPWPGNVRQLRNELERIVLMAGRRRVLTADLFEADGAAPAPPGGAAPLMATPDASPAPPPIEVSRRHTHNRRRRLRELVDQYERITRAEVVQLLGCSPNTATRDLRALEKEGTIKRVLTSAHLRTSYFVKTGTAS